jgi:multidrug transporter EmrE-like cation transporter
MNIIALVLILAGGVVLTVGDLIMKKWVAGGGNLIYGLGLAVYMVGMVFLSQSYRFKNIAVASLMLVIFNIVTLLIISWFFYHEQLSVLQFVGFIFGLISVVILELA